MKMVNIKTILLVLVNLVLLTATVVAGTFLFSSWQDRSLAQAILHVENQYDKDYGGSEVDKRSGQLGQSQVTAYYPKMGKHLTTALLTQIEENAKSLDQNEEQLVFYTTKEKKSSLAQVKEFQVNKDVFPIENKKLGKPQSSLLISYFVSAKQQLLTLAELFVSPEFARAKFEEEFRNQLAFRELSEDKIEKILQSLTDLDLSEWTFTYQDSAFKVFLPKPDAEVDSLSLPLSSLYDVIDQTYLQGEDLKNCQAYLENQHKKIVALTFDDGPSPETTPKVLDILKEHKAKATFFTVGQNIAGNEAIMKRILKEGSEIGNHSWSHPNLPTISLAQAQKEINDTTAEIKRAVGIDSKLMRPPYGALTPTIQNAVEQSFIMWSVDSLDWKERNTPAILNRVQAATHPGSIILMHDIHQTTVDALPAVLDYLGSQGYTYVTVSELLGDQLAPHLIYYNK